MEFFGSNHVLFGSASPFDLDEGENFTKEMLRSIHAMNILPEHRDGILSDKAGRILGST
jgi:hypothetical protein